MSESDLLAGVLDLARILGWRSLHLRPARTAHGWATAVSGDGVGFPDLLLVRRNRIVALELKAAKGRVTPEQAAWLDALREAGADARVIWPADYPDAVAAILR
jgi:hypothetical protein